MWAAVERANNFTRPGAIATRDVHIVALARYDGRLSHVSSYVKQGAGRPSTGSTGATLRIFLGRDI